MERAISETDRRRKIQQQFNEEHNIIPESIIKPVRDVLRPVEMVVRESGQEYYVNDQKGLSPVEIEKLIIKLEDEMKEVAENLEFELAAQIRDEIKELEKELADRGEK
jgi:excinuclease ABC subunit B